MRSHRTVFLRYISAAEHGSDQILVKSSSVIAWIVLLFSAPISLTFGYFVYLDIDSEYFVWRNNQYHGNTTFCEFLLQSDYLWITIATAIVSVSLLSLSLLAAWRVGTRWTVSTPTDHVIEIRKSTWFTTRIFRVHLEDTTICVGKYLNALYITKMIGWIDVVLVVGKHAFLVNYALLPDQADELAHRLAKKLGRETELFDNTGMLYLLPYFVFN